MFSLIITIICIALVAALILATVYYGGSAFNKHIKNTAAKEAQRIIDQGKAVTIVADTQVHISTDQYLRILKQNLEDVLRCNGGRR